MSDVIPPSITITICPLEATNCYEELTRFDVDPTVATLRDVADRIHADPLLYCRTAQIGLKLSPYEDDVTGDPIDLFNPAVAFEPLSAIVAHLLPEASARGGPVAFVSGQELWLVVDGCATEAEAVQYASGALLKAQFDAAAVAKAAAEAEAERVVGEAAARNDAAALIAGTGGDAEAALTLAARRGAMATSRRRECW